MRKQTTLRDTLLQEFNEVQIFHLSSPFNVLEINVVAVVCVGAETECNRRADE